MVDENAVELTCVYSTKLGFKQFGFSYGSKEGGMTDVISTDVQPHEFKVRLTSSMTRLIPIMPSYRMVQDVIRLSDPSSLQGPVLRKSQ